PDGDGRHADEVDRRYSEPDGQVRNGIGCPRERPDEPGRADDDADGVERGGDRGRQVAEIDRLRVAAGDDPAPASVPELLLRQGAEGGPRTVGDLESWSEPDQAAARANPV